MKKFKEKIHQNWPSCLKNQYIEECKRENMMKQFYLYSRRKVILNTGIVSSSRATVLNLNQIKTEVIVCLNEKVTCCIMRYNKDKVPYWKYRPVLSHSDINDATSEQKEFYDFFKNSFLNDDYIELEGNTIYSVILVYYLLNEYSKNRSIKELENRLIILSQCYPNTEIFALEKLNGKHWNIFSIYWKIGDKLKYIINLNKDEFEILNLLYRPRGRFCEIEFCLIEVAKLFLLLIKEMDTSFIKKSTSFIQEMNLIAELSIKDFDRSDPYLLDYYNSALKDRKERLYWKVIELCENKVREKYGYREMIDLKRQRGEFNSRILRKARSLLSKLISTVKIPDESTEVFLNALDNTRWRLKIEEIKSTFPVNGDQFYDSVMSLAMLNIKNPSICNIFYETSIFIASRNRLASLRLYAHYIYFGQRSAVIKNREFPKAAQEKLFDSVEQALDFKKIVNELVESNGIDKAIEEIPQIYIPKRKSILLDMSLIAEIENQHKSTIGLLNEVLKGDGDSHFVRNDPIGRGENKLNYLLTKYNDQFILTNIQVETLDFFVKSNFRLLNYDIEEYCKQKSTFKNTLIESLNELFYDFLGDVLIEEEEGEYVINEEYYQRILTK
jgi:hypothetical protein